jgi:hypothetical protein
VEGTVIETNPHFRNDVRVCPGHTVIIYVRQLPYREMPTLQNVAKLSDAKENLECKKSSNRNDQVPCRPVKEVMVRCTVGTGPKPDQDAYSKTVTWQWPAPNELIGVPVAKNMQSFPDVAQIAILEVTCKPLPGAEREIKDKQTPDRLNGEHEPQVNQPPNPFTAGNLAFGTGAGLLGGLWLAGYLRRRAPVASSPKSPKNTHVVVRGRADVP